MAGDIILFGLAGPVGYNTGNFIYQSLGGPWSIVDRYTPLTTRVRALREAFCFWKFCEVFSVCCVGRISEAAIGGPRSSFRVRLSSAGCSVAQKGAA